MAKEKKKDKITEGAEDLREQLKEQEQEQLQQDQQLGHQDTSNAANQTLVEESKNRNP